MTIYMALQDFLDNVSAGRPAALTFKRPMNLSQSIFDGAIACSPNPGSEYPSLIPDHLTNLDSGALPWTTYPPPT